MVVLVCEVLGWVWRGLSDPTDPGKRTLEPSKQVSCGYFSWGSDWDRSQ